MTWTTTSVRDAFIITDNNKWVRATAVIAVTPTDEGATVRLTDGSAYGVKGKSPRQVLETINEAMSAGGDA